MVNQVDEYRRLMGKRPPLHLATSNMRKWIGMVIQQYGTVALLLQDLEPKLEYYKIQNKVKQDIIVHLTKKAEKWDIIQAHISEAGKVLETNRKLEAILTSLDNWLTYDGELDSIIDIVTKILEIEER